MHSLVKRSHAAQRGALAEAFLSGATIPAGDVTGLKKMGDVIEDIFETSVGELTEAMEQINEYEQDQAARS